MNTEANTRARSNRRTAGILAAIACGMFGFGFALVPLYDLICESAGLQSISVRTRADAVDPSTYATDDTRELTVKFNVMVQPDLPWDFTAEMDRIEIRPGESYLVNFVAHNRSSHQVTGQAIPNIAPWQATPYFNKVECFCFNQQTLEGGERVDMPLLFVVSPDLPQGINSLTLSYSFMRLGESGAELELADSSAVN